MRVGVFLLAARFPGQSDEEVLAAAAAAERAVKRCASAGVTGPWDSRAPIDSPSSMPNAAM
jgi:hypothetical protein